MLGAESAFRQCLLRWYDRQRRDLPWREVDRQTKRPDPYRVLVSETMLQQTQVATVIPYFERFILLWPTVEALAGASQQEVLREWAGLGYYSRARNLHRAAQQIVASHGGKVPADVGSLRSLSGVGAYTAGAVASLAFDRREPIVDGNVIRVICRLDRLEVDPRVDSTAMKAMWRRAESLLPERRCGDFNSALMELGATVCTPRNPQCPVCPVRAYCAAAEAGVAHTLPPPRSAKPSPLRLRWTFCIRHRGKYLIEQRPPKGRWAGMWQFPTIPGVNGLAATPADVSKGVGMDVAGVECLGEIKHALTHRRYRFVVYACELVGSGRQPNGRKWLKLKDLQQYPLAKPQLAVAAMVAKTYFAAP